MPLKVVIMKLCLRFYSKVMQRLASLLRATMPKRTGGKWSSGRERSKSLATFVFDTRGHSLKMLNEVMKDRRK